jgi:hypothetical protein
VPNGVELPQDVAKLFRDDLRLLSILNNFPRIFAFSIRPAYDMLLTLGYTPSIMYEYFGYPADHVYDTFTTMYFLYGYFLEMNRGGCRVLLQEVTFRSTPSGEITEIISKTKIPSRRIEAELPFVLLRMDNTFSLYLFEPYLSLKKYEKDARYSFSIINVDLNAPDTIRVFVRVYTDRPKDIYVANFTLKDNGLDLVYVQPVSMLIFQQIEKPPELESLILQAAKELVSDMRSNLVNALSCAPEILNKLIESTVIYTLY